jgi:Acetamidase/Formamidase family
LPPAVTIEPGDFITIETLTHHAYDDHARMIAGDPGAEAVFHWTKDRKNVNRRGAGPVDASIHGRGAGEGFGVHLCTGPVHVTGAEPGDVLEVRIIDVRPRGCHNPTFAGRAFGSNAAAWWGFHYNDLLTEPKPREVVTIYEIDAAGGHNWARAVYNYRWVPQTDPSGVVHPRIDYPGFRSTMRWSRKIMASCAVCISRSGRISASSRWRRKRRSLSIRSRQAISAATSTIGGSAKGR